MILMGYGVCLRKTIKKSRKIDEGQFWNYIGVVGSINILILRIGVLQENLRGVKRLSQTTNN